MPILDGIEEQFSPELNWEGTFEDYLQKCVEYPPTIRTAHQRLYDALASYGSSEYLWLRRRVVRWHVFDDPFTENHYYAIYGKNVDVALMEIMEVLRAAANRLGQENRIYLLKGPVGTAKSTFAELCALALEDYTRKPEGQLFAPFWVIDENDDIGAEIIGTATRQFERHQRECPLHEEPLRVLPLELRRKVVEKMKSQLTNAELIDQSFLVKGHSCPLCDQIFRSFLRRYNNDWKKVVEKHLRVRRYLLDKHLRHGIVTARPKSEKDQDVSEFLGELNYANLGAYGSGRDPRAFDFAGHYMAANRGLFYWEEFLKFTTAFLYDCLGASQEHRVQPRGFTEVDIDVVLLGSTNEPEYKKLRQNERMEALRDRTITINIPYILILRDEEKIYSKFFNPKQLKGKHIAPRTRYLAAYWALLTRLKPSARTEDLNLRDKLKLYDGRQIPGITGDVVRELFLEGERQNEGFEGVSPRYVSDKISAAFMSTDSDCVDFFDVLRELKEGLPYYQHISSNEQREQWEELISLARKELDDRLIEDIRLAAIEEEEIEELCSRYLDQVEAYVNHEKVRDPITGEEVEPDEFLMQGVEDQLVVGDRDDFRQKIVNQMAKRARDRERDPSIPPFDYKTDERLYRALSRLLFNQVKEKINWERILSHKVLGENKEAESESDRLVDKVKRNLINGKFGPEKESYCQLCASKALSYVASVFVRGRQEEDEED